LVDGTQNPNIIQERYVNYYGLDEAVDPAIPTRGLLGWTGVGYERLNTDGQGNLRASVDQDVVVSNVNSSTTNLNASATFTGTAASTLGASLIQVALKTDQNCTVYVDQSPDGNNWDVNDTFHYNKILNNFSTEVRTVGAYFRVRVKNLSSTTATTYFRLQSLLCPIGDPVPRALDTYGHFQVDVNGLHDHYGFEGQFTPIRDLKVCEPSKMVGTKFGASIDANFWTASSSGTGAASGVSNGLATLASGTDNSGYAQLRTVRICRFSFTQPLQFRAGIRIPTVAVALNTRNWGAYTDTSRVPQNGVYFSLSETGVLSVNCVKAATPSSVASGSFNGDVSEYTVDTNFHFYEIIYFTAGAWFYIDGVLIHHFSLTSATLYNSLDNPVNMTSINTVAGVTSGVIECCNAAIVKLGKNINYPASKYQAGTTAGVNAKIGSGLVHSLTISGVVNNSVITLYDNTAASGTVLWSSGAMSNQTIPFSINFGIGIPFFTGLSFDIAAANSNLLIEFE